MKKCPFCAEEIQDDAVFCPICKSDLQAGFLPAGASPAGLLPSGSVPSDPMNAAPSGRGSGSPVPPEVGKRSWFGFWSPILFGIVNHVWAFALAGIGLVVAGFFLPADGQKLLGYASFGLSIGAYLLGGRLAWQSRAWESLDAFRTKQRRWAWISFAVTGVLTALCILWLFFGGTVLTSYDAHGVTFSPPPGWQFDEGGTRLTGLEPGLFEWNDAFFRTSAKTNNLIAVGRSTGDYPPPSSAGLDAFAQEVADDFAAESVGTPVGSAVVGADLPTAKVDNRMEVEGAPLGKRVYFVFGDGGLFVVRCQYDDAAETETLSACDEIVRTFTLGEEVP